MNFSWLSLIGGGFAAAATLTAGVSMSGLFSPATMSGTAANDATAAQTIYVEQPVVGVPTLAGPGNQTELPPLVIAILPAATATDASGSGATLGAGGETPVATPTPGSEIVTPTPPPSFSDSDDGGGDDGGFDDADGVESGEGGYDD